MKEAFRKIKHWLRWLRWLKCLRCLKVLNPFCYLKRLDRYIIAKFIGTYIFSIILIISISIVFDVNENLAKFSTYNAPLKAIVFDYYANFVPYFANLFSPLFVFIAVIFFTSAALIAAVNFYLGGYVIPKGNQVKMDFEAKYKNKERNLSASNVQLMVQPGVIAYLQQYDDVTKTGYGFSLDKFENKKVVSHMTATEIQYDTISESKYHWKATNWRIRDMRGMREKITNGATIDTLVMMEPTDLVFSKGQQETFTSPQLRDYISKQIDRGSGNVVQYEVEYHKRIASSFASFILTTIGLSLSSRKRKGGMGMYLGIGLALSFGYIMLQTVSATFAIQANTPAMLAAWIPNIIFSVVAWFCYRNAPN